MAVAHTDFLNFITCLQINLGDRNTTFYSIAFEPLEPAWAVVNHTDWSSAMDAPSAAARGIMVMAPPAENAPRDKSVWWVSVEREPVPAHPLRR